jgi:phenylalanyl-tRNA synthetase alpha chain
VEKLQARLEELWAESSEAIAAAESSEELEKLRVRYLGKSGEVTSILRGMGDLPAEARPIIGREANKLQGRVEQALQERMEAVERRERRQQLEAERVDVTLPGRPIPQGAVHPITAVIEEVREIFLGLGFQVARGPEVETEYYNFEALNVPKDHPARAMQDTFFVTDDIVLRTQTSPVQIRYMEQHAPELPVRIIAPGRVFRRDDDPTHSPNFYQVEGLLVDRRVTLGDLKGTLLEFARQMFGAMADIRMRPSYFPFTEPSGEVDVSCTLCGGEGCTTCGYSGWVEILGCGMVHPRVLRNGGYDPEEVSGFAFGMGPDRIAMVKYGIDNLRHFYTNDMRFLNQFRS